MTDGARRVLDLFLDPPAEAEWRPVLRACLACLRHTAAGLARCTALPFGAVKRAAMRATFPLIRVVRPMLPAKYRFIAPYTDFLFRRRGVDPGGDVAEARKRAGIRL